MMVEEIVTRIEIFSFLETEFFLYSPQKWW